MNEPENPTVFGKILRGEIPADIVYEDERCLAFRDANPAAPEHVLVIPRRHVSMLATATEGDEALLGHLLLVCARVAEVLGVADDGYRVVVNNGERANQTVFHLHFHLLAGRDMAWPPG